MNFTIRFGRRVVQITTTNSREQDERTQRRRTEAMKDAFALALSEHDREVARAAKRALPRHVRTSDGRIITFKPVGSVD